MTVAEIALAIMLVAGAGWLVRGFANLREHRLSASIADKRLIFDVTFQGQRYPNGDAVRTATTDMIQGVRATSGRHGRRRRRRRFPLRGTLENSLIMAVPGRGGRSAEANGHAAAIREPGLVRRDGHATWCRAGTSVRRTRPDGQRTAIVNRAFVKRYLNGRDPIGVQFAAGYPAPNPQQPGHRSSAWSTTCGRSRVELEAEPAFYSSLSQVPLRRLTMVVSTSLDDVGAAADGDSRARCARLDPQIAVDFELVTEVVASTISRQQLGMTLMLIFGVVAVAARGGRDLWRRSPTAVSQRRDEMATRLALGATPAQRVLAGHAAGRHAGAHRHR